MSELTPTQLRAGHWHSFLRFGYDDRCLGEDMDGRLWLGTGFGLSRYDGTQFRDFTEHDGIPEGEANHLTIDAHGRVWVSIQDHGVCCHDGTGFVTFSTKNGLPHNDVAALCADNHGNVWVGGHGLTRCDGETCTVFDEKQGLIGTEISAITVRRDDSVWVALRSGGIQRYDGKCFTTVLSPDRIGTITSMVEDGPGRLWMGTWGDGIRRLDGDEIVRFDDVEDLAGVSVRTMLCDSNGNVWIGTLDHGVICYACGEFITFTVPSGLPHNSVMGIMQNREGDILLACGSGGLVHYDTRGVTMIDAAPVREALMRASDGNIWWVAGNDVRRYDGERVETVWTMDTFVADLYEDGRGRLWIAARSGLYVVDGFPAVDGKRPVRIYASATPYQWVMRTREDGDGTIWTGLDDVGLLHIDAESNVAPIKDDKFRHPSVGAICRDHAGAMWVGSFKSPCITRFIDSQTIDYGTEDGLLDTRVTDIIEDTRNRIWIGSLSGISCFDGKSFKNYTRKDGLWGRRVQRLMQDSHGHIWVATLGSGVSRFDGTNFQVLTMEDGLPSNSVTGLVEDSDGTVIISTYAGVCRYVPDHDCAPPLVYVDSITADRTYLASEQISIASTVPWFHIRFHGVSHKTTHMRYEYILDGYDEEWKATRDSEVHYDHLPIGEYTFKVRAINRDLVYSEKPAMIEFSVVAGPHERMIEDLQVQLESKTDELRQAVAELQILSGLLPRCASCGAIRNDVGYIEQVDAYLRAHKRADATRGICTTCMVRSLGARRPDETESGATPPPAARGAEPVATPPAKEVVENKTSGTFVCSQDGKLVKIDESAISILDLDDRLPTPDKATGTSLATLFTAGDLVPELDKILAGGMPVTGRLASFDSPRGVRRWVRLDAQPAAATGTAPVWSVNVRDATLAVQRDLGKYLEPMEYSLAIDGIDEAVWIHDRAGRLLGVNRTACRMLGYEKDELLTRNLADIVQNFTLAGLGGVWHEAELGVRDTLVGAHKTKTGDAVPVRSRIKLIRYADRVLMLSAVIDIEKGERRHRVFSAGLRTVLDLLGDLLACHDTDSLYRKAVEHARDRLGIERCALYLVHDDIILGTWGTDRTGHTVDERSASFPMSDCWAEAVRPRAICEPPWHIDKEQFLVEFRDGHYRTIGTGWRALTPIRTERGVIGLLSNDTAISGDPVDAARQEVLLVLASILANIVELRRAEKEKTDAEMKLRHSEKLRALGELAGGVAHDFNNQLTAILGYAGLIKFQAQDSDLCNDIDEVMAAAERAAGLASRLLAFSRNEAPRRETTDINSLLHSVTHILKRSVDKNIRIIEKPDAAQPTVVGDPDMLQNAFLNIALNARDAMPDGGDLTIASSLANGPRDRETEPTLVQVTISDTGTGMDTETCRRVFEPFFTTKGQGAGHGLGLAAVYRTVKQHDGEIDVDSKLKVGTTFTISMPRAQRADTGDSPAPETGARTGSGTILVVDDEQHIRAMASRVLTKLGYEVTCCEDGEKALAFYRSNWRDIDLVILDVLMPGMNGRDTYTAMHRVNANVKAVVSSGFSMEPETRDLLAAEGLPFLRKPFTMEKLSQCVAEAFGKSEP